MDDKMKKIFLIVIAVFVVLIIFLFALTGCKKKYLPQELELEIINSAKNYYKYHTSELPADGNSISLGLNSLSQKGIIGELEDILEDDTVCSGQLVIENNNGYYMYSPIISCVYKNDSYASKNLYETLIENIVESGNGLYKIGNEYYFRGDNVNNYFVLDGIQWRIVKINEDNTIKIIQETKNESVVFDDRYNPEKDNNNGYNDYIFNNINSRIKDTLDNYYKNETVLTNDAKGYLKKFDLCVGKRNETDSIVDGSIECSNKVADQYYGLLQANEYMIASLDNKCISVISPDCRNYNYFTDLNKSFWTITADASNNYKVFKISDTVFAVNAANSAMARVVAHISENTSVSGTGSKDDPYVVIGTTSKLRKIDS